jgi:hypothetical protein
VAEEDIGAKCERIHVLGAHCVHLALLHL